MKFEFRLFHILQNLTILLFIVSIIWGIYEYNDYQEVTGNEIYWPIDYYFGNVIFYFFRPTVFLFAPIIGLFLKNRIGWILLTQYYCFLLLNMFIQMLNFDELVASDYLLYIIIVLIVVGLLLILNSKKVSFDYYKIKKEKLLINNMYSFMIGLLFSLLLLIVKS